MLKIFTSFQENPLHPRLEMQVNWFQSNGIQTKVYFDKSEKVSFLVNFYNRLLLKFFRLDLIRKYKRELDDCSIVHIYDFRLLPLAKHAKKAGKKVVYETLDDNVYLTYYTLEKKSIIFKWLKPLLVGWVSRKEQQWINNYCDEVIVNSPNLLKLSPKATLIYYSSPFEDVELSPYNPAAPYAFVYLGKLTVSKGAKYYEELVKEFNLPLHFYGQAKDDYSRDWLKRSDKVIEYGNLGSEDLKKALMKLSLQFNLIGLSIIIPENESYALQEANKDIDYMCLKIPFLGNERKPTYEKISAGAGVLYSDIRSINQLITNSENAYTRVQSIQQDLYTRMYSKDNFYFLLEKAYDKLK